MTKQLNLKNYCAGGNSNLRQIAELLNQSKVKTIFITSTNNRLIGSVTDGDLRRAIINGISLDHSISKVMNTEPKSVLRGQDEIRTASDLMKKFNLSIIPVVNKNDSVVDIINMTEHYYRKRLNYPVIIMAGGFGSRLMPLTKDTPKPMLNVGGKPILERIIDEFIDQGFHDFYISVHYLSEKIKDYFKDGQGKSIKITYIEENEPMGTGGCLSLLPKPLSALPYIIVNGDILSTIDFQSLINFHEENTSLATMVIRHLNVKVPFGVIESQGSKLKSIKEKPSLDVMINAGIYVINKEVLKTVNEKYIDMTDIFSSLLDKRKSVHCYPLVESWTDIGHPDDLNSAQSQF